MLIKGTTARLSLAQKRDLTGATISHHVSGLKEAGVLSDDGRGRSLQINSWVMWSSLEEKLLFAMCTVDQLSQYILLSINFMALTAGCSGRMEVWRRQWQYQKSEVAYLLSWIGLGDDQNQNDFDSVFLIGP